MKTILKSSTTYQANVASYPKWQAWMREKQTRP
jgi:hypothetical protein